jgi:proline iminopeptidase
MVEVGGGVRLRTWTEGAAGALPPVVLLHGGPGLWDYLAPLARMLAPLTVVHRFDQRGCGGSDPSTEHTTARYIADLEALRRHWGHRRWTVVGHSFGATLALAYAAAHPDRTAALGYLNGVGAGDWQTGYQVERHRRLTDRQRERLAELSAVPARSPAAEVEFRALCWVTDHADPVTGWRWALQDAAVDLKINTDANSMLNAETSRWPAAWLLAKASGLRMPCWFVHGAADPRPVGPVAALAAAVTAARWEVIELAGHQPWRERPDEVRRLLRLLARSAVRPVRDPEPA